MREYLSDRVFKFGFRLLVVGTGPLLAVMLISLGQANPIGLGMLAGLTIWPAVICMVIGAVRVRRRRG